MSYGFSIQVRGPKSTTAGSCPPIKKPSVSGFGVRIPSFGPNTEHHYLRTKIPLFWPHRTTKQRANRDQGVLQG